MEFLLLVAGSYFIIFPIVVIWYLRHQRRSIEELSEKIRASYLDLAQQKRDIAEVARAVEQLTTRCATLEQENLDLRARLELAGASVCEKESPLADHKADISKDKPPTSAAPAITADVPPPPMEEIITPREPTRPPLPPPLPTLPPPIRPEPERHVPPVAGTVAARSASPQAMPTRMANFEAILGGEWLNKIGIAVLVIGISLLIGYTFQYFGAVGKITLGFAVSGTLLVGGALLEKKPRYSLYARGLIGGGWALIYFTTYAMYHIRSVRIIDNQLWALILLSLVAAGVIAHSLKYRSQIVTGLAYLLGFITVALSHVTTFSLSASLILALSLVLILRQMNWYYLGLAGLIGTYLNYFLWLYPIIEALGGNKTLFQEFGLSVTFLTLFWLTFTSQTYLVRPRNDREEKTSDILTLINTLVVLALFAYQGRHPEWRYLFMIIFGSVHLVLAYFSHRIGRRGSYLINATTAVGALVAAVPLKLSDHAVTLTWILEAEVVWLAGFFLKEVYFRYLAWLLFALVTSKALFVDAFETTTFSLFDVAVRQRALTLAFLSTAFYLNAHRFSKTFKDLMANDTEQPARRVFSYAGSSLAALLVFLELDSMAVWVAPGWAIFAAILIELGMRYRNLDIRMQGYFLSALAFGRLFLVNFYAQGIVLGVSQRLITVSLTTLLFYSLAYRLHRARVNGLLSNVEHSTARVSFVIALALCGVGVLKALAPVMVGLSWLFLMLTFFTAGLFAVLVAYIGYKVLGLVIANVGLLKELLPETEKTPSEAFLYGASALVPILIWYEMPSVAVAGAWGLFGLALLEIGRWHRNVDLRFLGCVMSLSTFARLFFANFTADEPIYGLSARLVTVSLVIIYFYYMFFQLKADKEAGRLSRNERAFPDLHSYLAAMSLVVLFRFEMDTAWVVVAWSVLALGFLVISLQWDTRTFRFQSYLLSGAVLVRSTLTNLYLTSSFHGASERRMTVSLVIFFLYTCLFVMLFWQRSRAQSTSPASRGTRAVGGLEKVEELSTPLYFYSTTALMTLLLFLEISRGLLTVAWGVEGLCLFAIGLWLRERMFRLTGLVLLLGCIFKLFFVDLSGLETIYRITSFIVLGVILLLVSYLYTRYKEVITKFL